VDETSDKNQAPPETPSADSALSRQEFLKMALTAAGVGALFVAPVIVDKFLVPPAYAGSTGARYNTPVFGWDTTPSCTPARLGSYPSVN